MPLLAINPHGQIVSSSFEGNSELPSFTDESHVALGESSPRGEAIRRMMANKQAKLRVQQQRKFNALKALQAHQRKQRASKIETARKNRIAQFAVIASRKARILKEGRNQSRLGMDHPALVGNPFEGFGAEGKVIRSIHLKGEGISDPIIESSAFGSSTIANANYLNAIKAKDRSKLAVKKLISKNLRNSKARSVRVHPFLKSKLVGEHPMGLFGIKIKWPKIKLPSLKDIGKAIGNVGKAIGKVVMAPVRLAGEAVKLAANVASTIIEKTPLKFIDKITGGVVSGGLKAVKVIGKAAIIGGSLGDTKEKITRKELEEAAVGALKVGLAVAAGGTLSAIATNMAKSAATNATTGLLAKTPLGKTALGGALGAVAGAVVGGAGVGTALTEAGKSAAASEIGKRSAIGGAAFSAYTGKDGNLTEAAKAAGITAVSQKSAIGGAALSAYAAKGGTLADAGKTAGIMAVTQKSRVGGAALSAYAKPGGDISQAGKAALYAQSPIAGKVVNVIQSDKPGEAVKAAATLSPRQLASVPKEAKAAILRKATAENARGLAIKAVAKKTGVPVAKVEAVADGKSPGEVGVSPNVAKLTTDTVTIAQVQALKQLDQKTGIKSNVSEIVKERSENVVGIQADRLGINISDNSDPTISLKERNENAAELARIETAKIAQLRGVQIAKSQEAIEDTEELKIQAAKVQGLSDQYAKTPHPDLKKELDAETVKLEAKMAEVKKTGTQAVVVANAAAKEEQIGAVKIAAAKQGRYWAGYEFDHPMLQTGLI